jgi:putative acetyltransferase
MAIEIRDERAGDAAAIREVNDLAFDQPLEGRIVEALRAHDAVLVSLVAVVDGQVVGHILFSPASVAGCTGAALGPMAVRPEHQRRGIGAALIDAAMTRLAGAGCPFVVVLGHTEYYPRFGFVPAKPRGIRCEWDTVPDDVFMIRVLDAARMKGVSGQLRYRPEFTAAL